MLKFFINHDRFGTFFRYSIVGGTGFIIDAGLLNILIFVLGHSRIFSRVISFLCAVVVTYLLNRMFTFKVERKISYKEFLHYLSFNTLGSLINLGIYSLLVTISLFMYHYPILPVAIATMIAWVSNYFFNKHKVFAETHNAEL